MKSIYFSVTLCILFMISSFDFGHGAAVMSIDLGSEWMKVGVVSPGVPMEIALNKESKRKTPSVIAFRDGSRIFGEDAQSLSLRFPANSYFYLLDLLGKTVDNPIVTLYKKRFPYYEIVPDKDRNTVVFKTGDNYYKVEELVAQLIQKARDFAEESTGQKITECVIVVPSYFGQSERNALLTAATLANIKVLQLINDHAAVALNHAIFRRKDINETAQYYLFYDMGASKTSAAVISYQMVKDKATRETNPVIQVLGVSYDRTLGGLEMQLRLRDYLAKEFNKMKRTKTDVFTNNRAMAKLFKEAGRVKNVLSANSDHYAQIEGLLDDIDFKCQVTREKFEELCEDLYERVAKPLHQALSLSGLSLEHITQVILFGGGTRVPKIQEILKKSISQELGKNLNMDEAATMGAVYRAADLATGFKVKKFIVKDAVLFPIQIVFEKDLAAAASDNIDSDTNLSRRFIRRNLFGVMNSYPQKKVITFNKHVNDFIFSVNYADLDYLTKSEISYLGSLNLTTIKLTKVSDILQANLGDNVESKGIKAHFILDDSGIFSLSGTDLVLEKTIVTVPDDEGTLSKLSNTISKLFNSGGGGGGGDTAGAGAGDDENKIPNENDNESRNEQETETNTDSGTDDDVSPSSSTESTIGDGESATTTTPTPSSNKTEEIKPKIVTIKEPIPNTVEYLYVLPLTDDLLEESRKKILDLNNIEREITRRETALNLLESFVIETQIKIDEDEYASCATSDEADTVRTSCAAVSEWLYEDGSDATATIYEEKLDELKKLTNEIYARHWEHTERPDALDTLQKIIDGAEKFLSNIKNFTKDTNPEKDVFTQIELETLGNAINETIKWRDEEVTEQNKLKRYEPVRLTIKILSDKMAYLDREVKYLVNKLKIWKPKIKDVPKTDDDGNVTNKTTDNNNEKRKKLKDRILNNVAGSDDDAADAAAAAADVMGDEDQTGGEQIEFPEIATSDVENIISPTETNSDDDDDLTPRSDL